MIKIKNIKRRIKIIMAKSKKLFDLPQTKGEFQLRGLVTGTMKNNFFTEKKTKNGNNFRALNFGVEFDDKQTAYLTLNGMERKSVYYYNAKDKKTVDVAWKDRDKVPGEGYRLIGVNVGLERDEEDDSNVKYTLTDYDAAKYASEHLEDGMSVFVKGNLEFDSYTDGKGETKRSRKLVPTQISRCSKDVDFDSEDFEALSDFKITIVYQDIEKEKDESGKDTGRFVLSALVVNYSSIVPVDFIVEDAKLATLMKKNLKPFNSIEVTGKFKSSVLVEEVTNEDEWGEKSSFDRVSAPRVFSLVVTGAKPSSIDREAYTEENISTARRAIANKDKVESNFGEKKAEAASNDGWGDDSSFDNEDIPW